MKDGDRRITTRVETVTNGVSFARHMKRMFLDLVGIIGVFSIKILYAVHL